MGELEGLRPIRSRTRMVGRQEVGSTDLRPPRRLGVVVGSVVSATVVVVGLALAHRIATHPVGLGSFVAGLGVALLLSMATLLIYWTYSCLSLRYSIAGGALTITWGATRHAIPLGRIRRLLPGESVIRPRLAQGVNWPGQHVGQALAPGIGQVTIYATHVSPSKLVYVVTPEAVFALTADCRRLQALLDNAPWDTKPAGPAQVRHWPPLELPIWKDSSALALGGLALLANLLLFAYVTNAFPSLPELLSLHFTPSGTVDRIGYRDEVLRLPVMALVVWAANCALAIGLHGRERLASYLCLAAALFVQGLFLVALVKIVG